MRITAALFSLILLGLVGFEVYTNTLYSQRISKFRLIAETASNLGIELEATLGYGGLIHNFKNAVLRPGEPKYIDRAREDAKQAEVLIQRLAGLLERLGVASDLNAVEDMTQGYLASIETLPNLHGRGLDVTAIDALVRYNDDAAISATNSTLLLINAETRRTFDELKNAVLVQNLVGISIGIAALSVLFLYNMHRNQVTNLQAIAKANTELAALNNNLDKSNASLKQFAGIASHDLRAPVRTVSMFVHAILEEIKDPKAVTDYASMILEITDKMDALISSLLDFTRNGFKQPKFEPTKLNDLAESIASDLGLSTRGPENMLDIHPLPDIKCDPVLFARVFENLLSNSKKYRRADGLLKIDIRATVTQESILLRFFDNGIGIDPRYSARIFEPLQRLHADNSKYDGVGIGLALVKAVVDAHGGSIALDPTFTDGACFVVTLPAALCVKAAAIPAQRRRSAA